MFIRDRRKHRNDGLSRPRGQADIPGPGGGLEDAAQSGAKYDTIDPADGRILAKILACKVADVDAVAAPGFAGRATMAFIPTNTTLN